MHIDTDSFSSIAEGLRGLASVIEELAAEREPFNPNDLSNAIEEAEGASSTARDLASDIDGILDNSVRDIEGAVDSVRSDAESLESQLDDLAQTLRDLLP